MDIIFDNPFANHSFVFDPLNRNNANMSLLQLIQQLLSPSSIALNGNVQIGVRNINGIIEIFPASISYKGIVEDMFKNLAEGLNYYDIKYNSRR